MDKCSIMPIIMIDLNLPWERVLSLGKPVVFPAKSIIASDGDEKNISFYFIRRGCVRLSNVSLDGQDKVLFYVGQGTLFNEIPMLRFTSDCMFTCVEHTEAVLLPRKCVDTVFIRENPDLILNLLDSMSKKSQYFYSQICNVQQYDTFTNVCRTLLSMHLYHRKEKNIVPSLTQTDLAAYLGVHRSSLHKTMIRLRDEGVIGSYSKKRLEILDAERLWSYAQGKGKA